MEMFGEKNNLGNKSKNIIKLNNYKFLIPKTIILEKKEIENFNINKLKNNKKYILRPSFNLEDGNKKSYAGFFESIIFENKREIEIFFKKNKNNLEKQFGGKKYKLNSLIIQEFIETNIYGVYFTRKPNNIFEKGFYEIGKNSNEITSGNKKSKLRLNFLQNKELELIGNKLEKIFKFPQDIEFCIKNGKILLLQTRHITTGNDSIYDFSEIIKFNGIYKILDFDELGEKQDYFSYKVLNNLFNCIYINSKIYFKLKIIPDYLFKKTNNENINIELFYKNYKKYLFQKIFFNFVKKFIFQKINIKILKEIFKKYKYSFLLEEKSNINISFEFKNINFITKCFLKLEKQKNISFKYLEKYKIEYIKENETKLKQNIKKSNELGNNNISKKIIFINGIMINNLGNNEYYNWIYKGEIKGKMTDLKNLKYKKNLNQILIIENLNVDLYDRIHFIKGVIIKEGNSLSHNSIILREYKIPSIIKYKDFNKLKIGENISL